MAQNGNNIIVSIYNTSNSTWEAIAATKSDELTVDGDLIEISSSTVADWRVFLNGRKSWGLNTSWLVTTVADIKKVLKVGTRVQLRIGARTWAAGSGLTGYAWVKTAKASMTRGNLANGSFAFQGDGALQ